MPHVSPLRFHAAGPAEAVSPALWSSSSFPSADLQAVVVIPAKDEAEHLPMALAALAGQVDEQGHALPLHSFEVLVLANNCHDQTAQAARDFGVLHPHLALHVAETTLPATEAHVGRARRLLMDEACRRLELVNCTQGIIASTDADTQVAPTWLAATIKALAAGADAVGGRILMSDANPACPVRRFQLQDATYQLLRTRLEDLLDPAQHDPWPRHHQHFGASLALTAQAYRRVGGLPVVPYLEDEALYQALLRHDLRVRHSNAVRVFTSGRQQGRVAVGLSWQLREWAQLGSRQPLVDHPAQYAAELQLRRQLRRHWEGEVPSAASAAIPTVLMPAVEAIPEHPTFGSLWAWARPQLVESFPTVPPMPLQQATAELRRMLATTHVIG